MTPPAAAAGRTRVAVVHLLPVELYPPAINALRFLASDGRLDVTLITVEGAGGRPPFACEGVAVRRLAAIPGPGGPAGRFIRHLRQRRGARAELRRIRPGAILYYEPHSAAPVADHLRERGEEAARVCVHHHEYYAPAGFLRPGLRSVRSGYLREAREILPRAAWISQTNADRLRMFRDDHPGLRGDSLRVLPNLPPASWQGAWRRRAVRRSPDEPVRCVYVGSVSLDDTHLRSVCEWVRRQQGRVTLDILGHMVRADAAGWLRGLGCPWIGFEPGGVPYDRLPERLVRYEAGLILHRGCTPNYVYNTPNKLFEYQTCGLEAWVPAEMKGCAPFLQDARAPRVRCVDFERLDALDPGSVRAGLADAPAEPPRYCCEDVLAPLREVLAGGERAGS